jgi:hypothetical protein
MNRYRIVRDDGQLDSIAGQSFATYNEAYAVLERYYGGMCCSDDREYYSVEEDSVMVDSAAEDLADAQSGWTQAAERRQQRSAETQQTTEVMAGSIERVKFHSAENGFCVLCIKASGHRELVTVVGHATEISAGEWVTVCGTWVKSREDGQQFKAAFLSSLPRTTA